MILMMVVTVIMIGFDLFAVIMAVMIKEGSDKMFHLTTHSTHFTVIWCLT